MTSFDDNEKKSVWEEPVRIKNSKSEKSLKLLSSLFHCRRCFPKKVV